MIGHFLGADVAVLFSGHSRDSATKGLMQWQIQGIKGAIIVQLMNKYMTNSCTFSGSAVFSSPSSVSSLLTSSS